MQNALGLSALQTGVRFLPMTLLIIATAPIAGRMSDRFGSRWLLAVGMVLVAISLAIESRITATSGYETLLPAFIIGGVGMGLTMSPMTAAVMGSVDRTKAGVASGILSMSRMIGGVFGVATLTAVFQQITANRIPELMAQGESHQLAARDAFTYALSRSLLLSVAVALVGAVVAVVGIRSHHPAEPAPAPETDEDVALEPVLEPVG
jgi:MFS family permease